MSLEIAGAPAMAGDDARESMRNGEYRNHAVQLLRRVCSLRQCMTHRIPAIVDRVDVMLRGRPSKTVSAPTRSKTPEL